MSSYRDEIVANFANFTTKWRADLRSATVELDKSEEQFARSYERLVSLNAWRELLLDASLSKESLGFFLEAQNDALVSHVFARLGSWRSALKSLRSSIENVMFSLYYKDHPVELELWATGKHTLHFATMVTYFQTHPRVVVIGNALSGIDTLQAEYRTLSRAVHGSAANFRMSGNDSTALWIAEASSLGAWKTRETHVLTGINLLLLTLFSPQLRGGAHHSLREAVGLAIPSSYHVQLRNEMKVTLPR